MAVQRIVVGVTATETSQLAARRAVELAVAINAVVHFVTVIRHDKADILEVGSDRWEFNSFDDASREVTRFVRSLDTVVEHTIVAIEGRPADILVDEAKRIDADLIVVGNVRMQGLGRVLGSVGSDVVHHAPCDVLIVKTV